MVTVSIALVGAAAGAIVVVTRTSDLSNAAPLAAFGSTAPGAETRAQDSGTLDTIISAIDPVTPITSKPTEVEPTITAHRLTPDSIAGSVRSKYARELQNCYSRSARPSRDGSRKLIVTLHVGMNGQVVEYETNVPMKECKILKNMRFEPETGTDDVSRRIDVQVTFDYPAIPAPSGVPRPARVPGKCPAGTVWKSTESACMAVPPEDAKKCPPVEDGTVDPFAKAPCRR